MSLARSPLLFLVSRAAVNRIRRGVGMLRRPRYAVGVVAAGAYIYFLMVRPYTVREGPMALFAGLEGAHSALGVQLIAAAMVTLVGLMQMASGEEGVAFADNELMFLVPAPMSRAGLLRYKLLASQQGIGVFTLFVGYIVSSMPGGRPTAYIGAAVLFNVSLFFRIWWSLLLGGARTHGVRPGLVRSLSGLGALVLAASAFLAYEPIDSRPLQVWVSSIAASQPLATVLLPGKLLAGALVPGTPADFYAGLGACAGALGLLSIGIFTSRTPFLQASLALSARIATLRAQGPQTMSAAKRAESDRSYEPFALGPRGPALVAIVWKNLVAAGARFSPRNLVLAQLLAMVAGTAVGLWPGLEEKVPITAAGIAMYLSALGTMILSQLMRHDVRRDIPNFVTIRSLPIRGPSLLIGEVLGISLVVLGLLSIGWTFTACAVGRVDGQVLPVALRVPAYLGGLAVLGAVVFALYSIGNCMALMFPGWVQLGGHGQQGLSRMGQNMIGMLVKMVVLMGGLMVPSAAAGVVVALVLAIGGQGLGAVGVAAGLGGVVLAALLVAESLALLLVVGRTVYPRFDVASELV